MNFSDQINFLSLKMAESQQFKFHTKSSLIAYFTSLKAYLKVIRKICEFQNLAYKFVKFKDID